jgi:hypothetical protein
LSVVSHRSLVKKHLPPKSFFPKFFARRSKQVKNFLNISSNPAKSSARGNYGKIFNVLAFLLNLLTRARFWAIVTDFWLLPEFDKVTSSICNTRAPLIFGLSCP